MITYKNFFLGYFKYLQPQVTDSIFLIGLLHYFEQASDVH